MLFCMSFPKGSSIALGILLGAIIGILTDNAVSVIFLGAMFGIIGEMANKKR